MSTSGTINYKVIHKTYTQTSTVIKELQTFIERIERLSYYNVEFKSDLNHFSIFYDRCDHVDYNDITKAMEGLHSFDIEFTEYVLDGSTEPYSIYLVKGTGERINQLILHYPWLEIEDESDDLESFRE